MSMRKIRRNVGSVVLLLFMFTFCIFLNACLNSLPLVSQSVELTANCRYTAEEISTDQTAGSRVNYSSLEADNLVEMFHYRHNNASSSIFYSPDAEPYLNFTRKLNYQKKRGPVLAEHGYTTGNESWLVFDRGINANFIYNPNDDEILQNLIDDLDKQEIVSYEPQEGGTQFKLKMTLKNGARVLFKPKRFGRTQETWTNHIHYNDFERHQAEIAAYHLDKLLGFARVPPTIGRYLNVSRDILRLADEKFKQTFFESPLIDGELCFYGLCSQYCTIYYALCSENGMLEGSVSYYLPLRNSSVQRIVKEFKYPWKNYPKETFPGNEADICNYNRSYAMQLFMTKRFLPDILDMAVFDFLIGNRDRHHVDRFTEFGDNAFVLSYDQGKGFGRSKLDFENVLRPLYDCCLIRLSTLARLVKLYQGPDSLSYVFRESMSSDPVAPILWEPHLDAVDRRLHKVLVAVKKCVDKIGSWDDVVLDDGFL